MYIKLVPFLDMAKSGKSFTMLNVPSWIQKYYLVIPSTLTVQSKYVDNKLTFHRHWPDENCVYKS